VLENKTHAEETPHGKLAGKNTYQVLRHSATLYFAHKLYLHVLHNSHNKQPLLPYTILKDWFL
jgi:hypothetical protein